MYHYHFVVWGTNKLELREKKTCNKLLAFFSCCYDAEIKRENLGTASHPHAQPSYMYLPMLIKDACSLIECTMLPYFKYCKSIHSVNLLAIRTLIYQLIVRDLLAFYIFYAFKNTMYCLHQ